VTASGLHPQCLAGLREHHQRAAQAGEAVDFLLAVVGRPVQDPYPVGITGRLAGMRRADQDVPVYAFDGVDTACSAQGRPWPS
jgi:hypothetical protein